MISRKQLLLKVNDALDQISTIGEKGLPIKGSETEIINEVVAITAFINILQITSLTLDHVSDESFDQAISDPHCFESYCKLNQVIDDCPYINRNRN